jgi:type IV secretory pathway VirB10-like protein
VNPKDKPTPEPGSMPPIEAPAGLELHPRPATARQVSRRTGFAIGMVVLALLLGFAYGGYRRKQRTEAEARAAGLPKGVAPATTAGKEFVQAIPLNEAPLARPDAGHPLAPPGTLPPLAGTPVPPPAPGCGTDPRTGQPYPFDPHTGQPCSWSPASDRVLVRQAPSAYSAAPASAPLPTPEEQRRAAVEQREREAMLAPTAVRSGTGSTALPSASLAFSTGRPDDISQVAALARALSSRADPGPAASALQKALAPTGLGSSAEPDAEGQNLQTHKQAFLLAAQSRQSEPYLRSTRSAPVGAYEIKAGWEIPAALEQSLHSDLPGELKALVTANVYDTATGRFLLIPQGSRLVGRYDARIAYGQDGVQVVWERLIYPDASSLDLGGMVGLDAHGNAGLRDKVDRHYRRLFGFAALSSLFTAGFELSQRRSYGSGVVYPSAADTASAAVGREVSQTGAMLTRQNLNVQPTVKVPAGSKFNVRVNRDILFEAPYQPLQADPQPLVPAEGPFRRRNMNTIHSH